VERIVIGRSVGRVLAGAVLLSLTAGAAPQRHPALTALNGIEQGQWQLKDSDGSVRRICVSQRWALLQVMHGTTQCEHFVMENTPRTATIRYTCPSHGHGRTTISVLTPRSMRIETQGVADGAPFASDFDARRAGSCN
jgi:hypothetical protein